MISSKLKGHVIVSGENCQNKNKKPVEQMNWNAKHHFLKPREARKEEQQDMDHEP